MRIAHITDLHFSITPDKYDFQNLFEALLKKLEEEQRDKKIDIFLITGDLIDKGGRNIKNPKPFDEVLKEVINPIMERLKLTRKQIIFIPGNHDVCGEINPNHHLVGLRTRININDVNAEMENNLKKWNKQEMSCLDKFKQFERSFYRGLKDASFQAVHSNFETTFVCKFGDVRVGIAAFNSAWSCHTRLDGDRSKCKLAFGTAQIIRAGTLFRKEKTDFNIALLHHPINASIYDADEESEMKSHLSEWNFNMLFCGHTHEVKDNFIQEPNASYYLIVTKASLNNPRMQEEKYKSGFSLIDLSYHSEDQIAVTRHFRKYYPPHRFDSDAEEAAGGQRTLQMGSNKKFINYLKSQPGAFNPERKALMDTINSFSQLYINSPFPDDIGLALRSSFERFLPAESHFNYIRKDLDIQWEIRYLDDKYCKISELQKFKVLAPEPLTLRHAVDYEFTLDGKDKTKVACTRYLIDGKDKRKSFKATKHALPSQGKYGRELRKLVSEEKLSGKRQYNIEICTEGIHPLANAVARIFRRKSVVKGYKMVIKDIDGRFKIQLIGVGTDFYDSNVKENGTRTKKLVIDRSGEVLAPGMEFWLLVNLL